MNQVSHKEQLKALKGPDAFQARVLLALEWLTKNTRLLLVLIAPVVVVLIASLGWRYVTKVRKDQRLAALGQVQIIFDGELRKAGDARQAVNKEIEAIDKKISEAAAKNPNQAADAAPPPADPALTAEKDTLEKKLEAIKPDHSQSVLKFKEYFAAHPDTAEGWMAAMTAAGIFANEAKFAEARPLLEAVVSQSKNHTFYQAQARLSLVGVLEEAGEFDQALAQIEALDKQAGKDLKPRLLLAKGRILLLKNDQEQAKATFSNLIDNFAASAEAQKARSIQALIN